jgi:hypothetical protein
LELEKGWIRLEDLNSARGVSRVLQSHLHHLVSELAVGRRQPEAPILNPMIRQTLRRQEYFHWGDEIEICKRIRILELWNRRVTPCRRNRNVHHRLENQYGRSTPYHSSKSTKFESWEPSDTFLGIHRVLLGKTSIMQVLEPSFTTRMVDTHLKVTLSTLDLDLSKNEDDNKPRTYYAQPITRTSIYV